MNDKTSHQPGNGTGKPSKKGKHRKGPPRSYVGKQDAAPLDSIPEDVPVVLPQPVVEAEADEMPVSEETTSAVSETTGSSETAEAYVSTAVVGESEDVAVEPTLVAYFQKLPVKPANFLKALKEAKVSRFTGADISNVDSLVAANDKDGSRLWQLVTGASSSDAVSAWLWPVIKNRVNLLVGSLVDLNLQAPSQILKDVVTSLSGALGSDDKERVKRAENDLRLAVAWLIEKRNIEATDVADRLRHLYVTSDEAERRVLKSMASGSKVEFQASVAALCLAEDQLRRAHLERDVERNKRFDTRAKLDALREQTAVHTQTIRQLEEDKAELERQLAEERVRSDNDRRFQAHSSSQTKADFGLAMQRVKTLVEEAGEAVQIAMKRSDEGSVRGLQAAERRIRSAVDAMTDIGK